MSFSYRTGIARRQAGSPLASRAKFARIHLRSGNKPRMLVRFARPSGRRRAIVIGGGVVLLVLGVWTDTALIDVGVLRTPFADTNATQGATFRFTLPIEDTALVSDGDEHNPAGKAVVQGGVERHLSKNHHSNLKRSHTCHISRPMTNGAAI
jgi:hypothetical protein